MKVTGLLSFLDRDLTRSCGGGGELRGKVKAES